MRLRISILFLLCIAALLVTASLVQSEEATRPNVIFILTDDQGSGDACFAGQSGGQRFNLGTDLAELRNVALPHPEAVNELAALLDKARVASQTLP